MIVVSQAAAAAGSMPEPAVILGGPVHLHDNLAGHVHAHGGDNAAGHVHGAPDPDHDDADEVTASAVLLLSLHAPPSCRRRQLARFPIDVVTAEDLPPSARRASSPTA